MKETAPRLESFGTNSSPVYIFSASHNFIVIYILVGCCEGFSLLNSPFFPIIPETPPRYPPRPLCWISLGLSHFSLLLPFFHSGVLIPEHNRITPLLLMPEPVILSALCLIYALCRSLTPHLGPIPCVHYSILFFNSTDITLYFSAWLSSKNSIH